MSVSSSSLILLMLVAKAACDVNYFYPYYGRTVVAGGGQVLVRRPLVQEVGSVNRVSVLDANSLGFGGIVSRPMLPVPNIMGSAVVMEADIYDSSDIFSDDRVVLIG